MKKVLDFIKSEIDDSRQAYFVAPCIDENPELELKSVERIKADLEKYYKNLRIGLLHGKLNKEEKDEVLDDFMNKKIDILVSTTVIEVGINNTNASSIVIIDANHFGLSNLHQLRGRVGRGEYEGYFRFPLYNEIPLSIFDDASLKYNLSLGVIKLHLKEYMERLRILEETQDGFLISEADLKDRGPGDFLGTEQSGMLKFRFANIFTDKILFENF